MFALYKILTPDGGLSFLLFTSQEFWTPILNSCSQVQSRTCSTAVILSAMLYAAVCKQQKPAFQLTTSSNNSIRIHYLREKLLVWILGVQEVVRDEDVTSGLLHITIQQKCHCARLILTATVNSEQ